MTVSLPPHMAADAKDGFILQPIIISEIPMPRKKHVLMPEAGVEALIRAAKTIGQLERLAGLEPADHARAAFWLPFAKIPPLRAAVSTPEPLP